MAAPEIDSIVHIPFSPGYFKEMRIVKLKPFEKVGWLCIAGANEWLTTEITFELMEADQSNLLFDHPEMEGQMQQLSTKDAVTLLSFNHSRWKGYTPMFAECNYTWGRFLRSLKKFCETGTGNPWPHQHQ
jgi:hypothetical protein